MNIRLENGRLVISPCLPKALSGYEASWTDEAGKVRSIRVSGGSITVDGVEYDGKPLDSAK